MVDFPTASFTPSPFTVKIVECIFSEAAWLTSSDTSLAKTYTIDTAGLVERFEYKKSNSGCVVEIKIFEEVDDELILHDGSILTSTEATDGKT